jgi:hypothetical protein
MSDANAVAVLASLVSWYPLTSDMADAHGSNDLGTGVTASYEAGGKVGGNRLAAGSKGACTLAASIAHTASTGQFYVGGWIYYAGASVPAQAEFGLSTDYLQHNESLTIDGSSGTFSGFGWAGVPPATNVATDPNVAGLAYNFTISVDDSVPVTADSAQQIIIRDSGDPYAEGWYFVVAVWDLGIIRLYVNNNLVATSAQATTIHASPIANFQIGNQYLGALTQGALSQIFFGNGAVLTAAQIAYLYNSGTGKSYANVTADAA